MAMTDTRPTTEQADAPSVATRPAGLGGLLGTGDHTSLGRIWVGCSLLFGLLGLALNAVWGLELLGTGDKGVLPESRIATAMAAGRLALPLLFVAPLLIGLATLVVPLQVGARTVAFPRAAAAALWTWLLSSLLFVVAVAIGGGPGGTKTEGIDLSLMALAGIVVAVLLAGVCLFTTVFTLRTPGMSLDRVPFFSWSVAVAAAIWMLTLPVVLGNVLLILLDHKYGAPTELGLAKNQFGQIAWLVTQPQVFAFVIPALGIVADIVPTLSRIRQANRGLVMVGIGAFGALSVGAYVQPYFAEGVWSSWIAVGQAALLLLPLLLLLGAAITSLKDGEPKFASPLLGGVLGLLVVILGALAAAAFGLKGLGLMQPVSPLASIPVVKATASALPVYQLGVGSLALLGAAAVGIAGVFYWGAKLTGRVLSEGLGKLAVLLAFLGAAIAGLSYVVLGFGNKVSAIADAHDLFAAGGALGAAIAALGVLLTGVALLARGGDRADDDPWGSGQSLEWATSSPPEPGNFGELAVVESAEPVLDTKEVQ